MNSGYIRMQGGKEFRTRPRLHSDRTVATMDIQQRRDILGREIATYVKRGFFVQSQTDTTAQLVKAKRFSFLWALFWLVLGIGIGLILYIFWHISRRDQSVYLTVDDAGRVVKR